MVAAAVAAVVFSAAGAHAATITARSASLTDVRAAVASAVSGDTVQVPAGAATWSSPLSISSGITLAGAGVGQTVITSGISDKYSAVLLYSPALPSLNETFRVTGFTFEGAWKSSAIILNNSSSSSLTRIRIDHNLFRNNIQYAIRMDGEVFGLVDSNQFIDNYIGTQILGRNWLSWEQFPLAPGTASYPYFENNSYVYTGAKTDLAFVLESGQGGRYVFRYNTIDVQANNLGGALEIFDAHGNQDPVTSAYRPNGSRGTLGVEIYENEINLRASHRILNLRGGEAKVFNNTITQIGGSGSYVNLTEYDGWSYHFLSAYPGYDPVKNAFFWNNKINGSDLVPELYSSSDSTFVKENRDWFQPLYGAASARPGSCSTGAFYGTVDSGTLFRCASANTWSPSYTQLEFPHPLARSAPSHFRIE
jgi:hypothetical protein